MWTPETDLPRSFSKLSSEKLNEYDMDNKTSQLIPKSSQGIKGRFAKLLNKSDHDFLAYKKADELAKSIYEEYKENLHKIKNEDLTAASTFLHALKDKVIEEECSGKINKILGQFDALKKPDLQVKQITNPNSKIQFDKLRNPKKETQTQEKVAHTSEKVASTQEKVTVAPKNQTPSDLIKAASKQNPKVIHQVKRDLVKALKQEPKIEEGPILMLKKRRVTIETLKEIKCSQEFKGLIQDFEKFSQKGEGSEFELIKGTLYHLATYEANLKLAMIELSSFAPNKPITNEAADKFQMKLNDTLGSHFRTRIMGTPPKPEKLTPDNIEKYFRGQFNIVKDLYSQANKEARLSEFISGLTSQACFEDRISHLYQHYTEGKEKEIVVRSPEERLTESYNLFSTQQQEKMNKEHPELENLHGKEKFNLIEELSREYFSFNEFEQFVKNSQKEDAFISNQLKEFWNKATGEDI